MNAPAPAPAPPSWVAFSGFLGGVFAAAMWAGYIVASRFGVLRVDLTPWDLSFARYGAAGLALAPFALAYGLRTCAGVGWKRGFVLFLGAGPLFHLLIVFGVVFAPVHQGGVVGPAMAGVAGMALGAWVLGERPSRARLAGAGLIVASALALALEGAWAGASLRNLLGMAMVSVAGCLWAVFTMTLRMWNIPPLRATTALGLVSLTLYTPLYFLVFGGAGRLDVLTSGWFLSQAALQGLGASVLGIIAYAWAVRALGASVASVFPAMVPAMAVAIAWFALAEKPNGFQTAAIATTTLGIALAGGLAGLFASRPTSRPPARPRA